eukprot:m.25085 g.25085  ORF g.25085 m.25085 type:complete len:189 (+) comp5728_c0_seq2:1502-2068(+)
MLSFQLNICNVYSSNTFWLFMSLFFYSPGLLPLYAFSGATAVALTFYGGLFSVLPAYLADLFGEKHVGAIHGRQLTAWSAAALGGPMLLSALRERSYNESVYDLIDKVSDTDFAAKFGAGKDAVEQLVAMKTVTITSLMDIAPAGTLDPTPGLYNTTLYSMAGLLTCAVICNALIKPVDPKHFIQEQK